MSYQKSSVLYTAFDVVPSPKGASTHITHFTQGLVTAGYDVQLVTAGHPNLPDKDTYYGARVQRVYSEETNFLRRATAFSQAVRDHLKRQPPYTVAHFRSIWGGLPATASQNRLGHRTLFEVNGLPSIELKYHYPVLKGASLLKKLAQQEQAVLDHTDLIICPSRVTAAYIHSLQTPPEKITVIPNGVDTLLFKPQTDVPPASSVPILLYVGTLARWQGIDLLLSALPLILEKQPVQLVIVGRGRKTQKKALQKQIKKMELADFAVLKGHLPHHTIPQIINQATICVTPLGFNDRNVTQGCCPIKLLEYLACRRPVVAANLPVVRELAQDGVDALLFEPDDPVDLTRKLLYLLENPSVANKLANNGHARVKRDFTWSKACASLQDTYDKLIERPFTKHPSHDKESS
jgi:glycosyltransferase involved in cell wall biosynthesis